GVEIHMGVVAADGWCVLQCGVHGFFALMVFLHRQTAGSAAHRAFSDPGCPPRYIAAMPFALFPWRAAC
ncbi:MAG: hypothetical protein ACI83N_000473, partial [Hydrogenophaga sp.]